MTHIGFLLDSLGLELKKRSFRDFRHPAIIANNNSFFSFFTQKILLSTSYILVIESMKDKHTFLVDNS